MLNPFIHLISNLISLVNLAVIAWAILSTLRSLDIVNRYNPIVERIFATLSRLVDPLLNPIRKQLHRVFPNLDIDLSPIALLLILHFVDNAMYSWFYSI